MEAWIVMMLVSKGNEIYALKVKNGDNQDEVPGATTSRSGCSGKNDARIPYQTIRLAKESECF